VHKVILIADAGYHRYKKGQSNSDGKIMPTDIHIETAQLKAKNIPVYTFTINASEDDKQAFRDIANWTSGKWEDLKNPSDLIDVVCEGALDEIGGTELVAEYRAKNKK